jgi:hypothetical protein
MTDPLAYSLNLLALKSALVEARKYAERVIESESIDPHAASFLWNNLTGISYLVREEYTRVKSMLPDDEEAVEVLEDE